MDNGIICPPGTIKYKVKQGDTPEKIAKKFGLNIADLLLYNKRISPHRLAIGQELCIPTRNFGCPNGRFYTIQAGDTLTSISKNNGLFLKDILEANPYLNPNYYEAGQVICIPEMPMCPEGSTSYVLHKGEDIVEVLKKFSLSLQALSDYNAGKNIANAREGDEICIPDARPGVLCPGGRLYTFKEGDTLESVALEYGLTTKSIMIQNPGLMPADFVPGRTVCLPLFMTTGE